MFIDNTVLFFFFIIKLDIYYLKGGKEREEEERDRERERKRGNACAPALSYS